MARREFSELNYLINKSKDLLTKSHIGSIQNFTPWLSTRIRQNILRTYGYFLTLVRLSLFDLLDRFKKLSLFYEKTSFL